MTEFDQGRLGANRGAVREPTADEMEQVQERLLRAAWEESNRRTIRASSRNRSEEPPPARS